MKVNLKRRENLDVITNLLIVCCDVIKNVTSNFELVIVDVETRIDTIDFELVCKDIIKNVINVFEIVIDVSSWAKIDAIIVVKISNLSFFAWCFSTCLCNFVLLRNLIEQRRHANVSTTWRVCSTCYFFCAIRSFSTFWRSKVKRICWVCCCSFVVRSTF